MEQPSLLKSRKFWLMCLDVVVSLLLYFVPKWLAPDSAQDMLVVIAAIQPIFVAVITSITVQNVQAMKYLPPKTITIQQPLTGGSEAPVWVNPPQPEGEQYTREGRA
jgi:hypothetical protein